MGNFKGIVIQELDQFIKEHHKLTLAESLYAFLRPTVLKKQQGSMNWLLGVSDEELYEAVETAKLIEHEG